MTQLPDWLVQDAPFDVKQFWITVPPEDNAAPLYLDALYEFTPEMEVCFGPDVRAQRTAAAKARYDRSYRLQLDWNAYPQPKRDPTERDAVLQEHIAGFEKFEAAQKRSRCVFDIGWDLASQILVIHAAREVSRVAQLQVERDIERGDIDAVVRIIRIMLRLSRDFRPRTPTTLQVIGDAVDSMISTGMIVPALKSPLLKTAQCDELLRLLVQHDSFVRSLDPYVSGLRGDYLSKRMLLHDLLQKSGEFADSQFRQAFGGVNETRGAALLTALNGNSRLLNTEPPSPVLGKFVDIVLTRAQPADFESCVGLLKEKYKALSSSAAQPYAAAVAAHKSLMEKSQSELKPLLANVEPPKNLTPDQQSEFAASALEKRLAQGASTGPLLAFFLTGKLENDIDAGHQAFESDSRSQIRRHGMQALTALRRWYGTHANPPTDFSTMCREAGLTDLPRDFYGSGPLRMATFAADTAIQHPHQKDLKAVAGETIVYSVGPDGVDDKALREYGYFPNGPGDWLFRLEIPQSAIPVTPAPAASSLVPGR